MCRKSKENFKMLFGLIMQHQTLPIIPMVDGELVADNSYQRWMGSFGKSRVKRYFIGQEGVYFYDEADKYDCLCDPAVNVDLDSSEENLLTVYRSLPWKEAIIVDIDMPNPNE